ncbi:MAG: helix-turn-helix transcriptional regulator, partial [Clostridiales bacterium]|nr:helix-turn-helix transcriptional regulator [Clostridiales bacterium]
MNLIAKNIKHLREARGMSQVDVAKRIGASDKAVSAWERGA